MHGVCPGPRPEMRSDARQKTKPHEQASTSDNPLKKLEMNRSKRLGFTGSAVGVFLENDVELQRLNQFPASVAQDIISQEKTIAIRST